MRKVAIVPTIKAIGKRAEVTVMVVIKSRARRETTPAIFYKRGEIPAALRSLATLNAVVIVGFNSFPAITLKDLLFN